MLCPTFNGRFGPIADIATVSIPVSTATAKPAMTPRAR